MRRLVPWLKGRSKLWVLGAGLVYTAIVGLIDYLPAVFHTSRLINGAMVQNLDR
jgi:hypothetical protein